MPLLPFQLQLGEPFRSNLMPLQLFKTLPVLATAATRACTTLWSAGMIAAIAGQSVCFGASLSTPRHGIFVIADESGAVHLSDNESAPGARLLVEVAPETAPARPLTRSSLGGSNSVSHRLLHDARTAAIVHDAAKTQRISPELLQALITTESGDMAGAVSHRGAQGLMQLMPATARVYGVTDPFDPFQNIRAGAQHLRYLLDRFGGDERLALAAYNAGEAAVVRHGYRIPPYPETLNYVPRVLARFIALRAQSASASAAPSVDP